MYFLMVGNTIVDEVTTMDEVRHSGVTSYFECEVRESTLDFSSEDGEYITVSVM